MYYNGVEILGTIMPIIVGFIIGVFFGMNLANLMGKNAEEEQEEKK